MTQGEEKDLEAVFAGIEKFAQTIGLKRKLTDLTYRKDSQDYQFILDQDYHCEIRGKLIDGFFADPKNGDILREIKFRLENAPAFEDIEDRGSKQGKPEEKIEIEDDD